MSQVFCYFFKNYTFIINISGETLQMENEVNYADLPDELFEQIETFIKTELPGDIIFTIFLTILIAECYFSLSTIQFKIIYI